MVNRDEKRIDITVDAVKQQITLAAGIIAGMIALASSQDPFWRQLPLALAPFVLSLICGLLVMLSVPYSLYEDGDPLGSRGVRIAGAMQSLFFLLGSALLVYLVGQTCGV